MSQRVISPLITLICFAFAAVSIAACTATPTPSAALPTLAMLPSDTPDLKAVDGDLPPTSLHKSLADEADTPQPGATELPTLTNTPTPSATDTAMPTVIAPAIATDTPSVLITSIPLNTATITPSPRWIPSVTFTPSVTYTPSATWTASPTRPIVAGDATISTTSQTLVNLLSGPGYDYPVVQALGSGTPLFLIGRSWDDQWYQVRLLSGQEGWVYGLYLVIWIDTTRLVVSAPQPTQPPVARVEGFALGGHVMNLSSRAFDIASSAGMTWIKVQHRFYVGQDAGQELAGAIRTAHDRGFKILLGIVGDKAQMGNLDSYAASYAAFVADVAALGTDAIEVWNEPNIDHEWPAGTIYGANYTKLLSAAYTAIKARAPNTIVISAAPAPTGFFGGSGCDTGGCNDDIFFKQMAAAGAADYLDCVGLHHNDGIVSPTSSAGDPRGSYPTYYLTGVISRVPPEFSSKPICFTELGYLSPEGYGSLPGNFGWAANTTVAQQAEWLGQAVQVARSTGRVEMMIVWNVDFTTYTASDPMAGYAIERPNGGCPACGVLAQAMG